MTIEGRLTRFHPQAGSYTRRRKLLFDGTSQLICLSSLLCLALCSSHVDIDSRHAIRINSRFGTEKMTMPDPHGHRLRIHR